MIRRALYWLSRTLFAARYEDGKRVRRGDRVGYDFGKGLEVGTVLRNHDDKTGCILVRFPSGLTWISSYDLEWIGGNP